MSSDQGVGTVEPDALAEVRNRAFANGVNPSFIITFPVANLPSPSLPTETPCTRTERTPSE